MWTLTAVENVLLQRFCRQKIMLVVPLKLTNVWFFWKKNPQKTTAISYNNLQMQQHILMYMYMFVNKNTFLQVVPKCWDNLQQFRENTLVGNSCTLGSAERFSPNKSGSSLFNIHPHFIRLFLFTWEHVSYMYTQQIKKNPTHQF